MKDSNMIFTIKNIQWYPHEGDTVLSLSAEVTFNRPYLEQFTGKLYTTKSFNYGMSRGSLPAGMTMGEFEALATDRLEKLIEDFMREHA